MKKNILVLIAAILGFVTIFGFLSSLLIVLSPSFKDSFIEGFTGTAGGSELDPAAVADLFVNVCTTVLIIFVIGVGLFSVLALLTYLMIIKSKTAILLIGIGFIAFGSWLSGVFVLVGRSQMLRENTLA